VKEIGIYVHIPFCKQKCYYCDFLSFAGCEKKADEYVQALLKEIEKNKMENIVVSTIYIGGGTPSIINAKYIEEIIYKIKENYKILENAEITIEVNPESASEEKIKKYKEVGINRISIGLQSTNNQILKEIGRIHDYEQFLHTYNTTRKIGFNNINVDLMLALPNQSLEDIEESVEKVIELEPEHISIYSLILEEETKLEKLVSENKVQLPNEDIERDMYWNVKQKLEENNYKHYEISNFAKQGYQSKHNMNCWEQMEYLGFGLGAHSYWEGKRYSNINDLDKYICNIKNNQFVKNIQVHEIQNKLDKEKEYMILGLRKIDGIKISKFKAKFIDNPLYIFRKEIEKLVNEELIEVDLDNIKLTNKGLDLANIVWEEFI